MTKHRGIPGSYGVYIPVTILIVKQCPFCAAEGKGKGMLFMLGKRVPDIFAVPG
jgi:hypothetical protein